MKYLYFFILFLSTYLVGMHHEKLDVVVFAIDLEIIENQDSNARDFVSRITNNVKDKESQTLVYQYHFSWIGITLKVQLYKNNEYVKFIKSLKRQFTK